MKKEITCSENGSIRLMDKIIVTDPCYKEKIWCNEVVDNVLPATTKSISVEPNRKNTCTTAYPV